MRWLWCALATSAIAFSTSGCGTSGNGIFTPAPGGGEEGGASLDATSPGNLIPDDGSVGAEGGSGLPCTPRTCAQAGASCGPVADLCGGLLQCGTCGAGESCGGGGTHSVCGGPPACVPKTCGDPSLANLCGQQLDGCGNVLPAPCVTCTGKETCGGGDAGAPSVCGGSSACIPFTAASQCVTAAGSPITCGVVGDGCNGEITCGACPAGETCGGGGVPYACGSATVKPLPDGGVEIVDAGDAGSVCAPATACPSGVTCGTYGDGCGGVISCGTCTGSDTCGGGGTGFVCGHSCTKAMACPAGINCGSWPDGCGGLIPCGTCTGLDTCGGGGTPSVCGHACTPLAGCPAGVNCGPWSDGCGGIIPSCGTCTLPEVCGGGGVGSQCGNSSTSVGCDAGLKCNLTECDGGATTSLKGQVFDPAGNDPLYNVVVYVPNSTPGAFTHGPTCDACSSLYTGDPIVSTTTDTDGNFTLAGVPVPLTGANAGQVPVVIQVGKWRRQLIWPNVTACGTNTVTPTSTVGKLLRLPGAQSASGTTLAVGTTVDDLPEIAISTGAADSMECLFQRIGFANSEYVPGWNSGTGHLHVFQGTPEPTSAKSRNPATTSGTAAPSSPGTGGLWDSDGDIDNYDIVVLSCEGEETVNANPTVLQDFTTKGGRAFASHFHYSWFSGPLDSTETYTAPAAWGTNLATWTGNSNPIDIKIGGNWDNQLNANIVESLADGGTPLKTWLGNVNALGTGGVTGELFIKQPRFNAQVTAANTPSQSWIVPDNAAYQYEYDNVPHRTALPASSTQYFAFDTPVGGLDGGSSSYCGRIVYSDLHVGSAANDYSSFTATSSQPHVPGDCAQTGGGGVPTLSPQEKALEYMLLDLSSCVGSDTNLPTPPPTCTALTACPAGYTCGDYPDGCGGYVTCGSCPTGATCVGGTKCEVCQPLTACPSGVVCGEWPDGCGGSISCGMCPVADTCVSGVCTPGCVPATMCPAGITCGPTGDGCGGTISCGTCPAGTTCGGGGTPGQCGSSDANTCAPQPCPPSIQCGPTGDGCGGITSCGTCPAGETCGGAGTPGVCGTPSCTPATCSSLGLNCGQAADGCGGLTMDCGKCTGTQTCGGGGTPGVCGLPPCTPVTCAQLGDNCGPIGDGCGNVLQCGTCTAPQTCGGGGTANVCGTPSLPK